MERARADEQLEVGMVGERSVTVTAEMAASAYGNHGVDVLATPYLVGLLEQASVLAILERLRPGESTVGTRVDVQHLAATPVGMTVTVRARLERVEGRRLTFAVEAHDDREQVATGVHERFVIDLDRFLAGAQRKLERARGS